MEDKLCTTSRISLNLIVELTPQESIGIVLYVIAY